MKPRDYLFSLLQTALASVNGRDCVMRFLRSQHWPRPDYVIAIGKAAGAMTQGVFNHYGADPPPALVISKHVYMPAELLVSPRCRILEGGHPLPDAQSLAAGSYLLEFIQSLKPGSKVLCLISGGASALVEVLPSGITFDDLLRANQWLIGSGLDIQSINAVRKCLSTIKGGGLAAQLAGHEVTGLVISDVIGDDPAVIGSGLLQAESGPAQLPTGLPDWLQDIINRGLGDRRFSVNTQARIRIIATNQQACAAVADKARADGWPVHVISAPLQGDARQAGEDFARILMNQAQGIVIQGGETTVRLPPIPGRGGRNQTFALAAATVLAGGSPAWVLAAGTDGIDGITSHAGALVDHESLFRGQQAGLQATDYLARADATTFLEITGDTIDTGYTGTNVMDIIIALKYGASLSY